MTTSTDTSHKYNITHTYKVVRSVPNLSDPKFDEISTPVAVLPASVDLRPHCPPVYNQESLGSCTGNAIAGAFEFDAMKQGQAPVTPSRLFIYYNERLMEGDPQVDNGAQIRDGIQSIATNGVCSEALWPYNEAQFAVKPSPAAYADAAKHKALKYYTLNIDQTSVKQALAQGYPIVVGIIVFPELESAQVAQTGIVPMPGPMDRPLGGHAVMIVGYDDTKQHLIMRNSWGEQWGDHGYFYLPYTYMTPQLMTDLWVITAVI
jgi:C1A family cysteine protease